MAFLLTLNVATRSDDWLRSLVNGADTRPQPMTLQCAIVETAAEANRIIGAMIALKRQRGLAYGGASYQALVSDELVPLGAPWIYSH